MAQVVGKISVLTTDKNGYYRIKVDDKFYGLGTKEAPEGITQGMTVEFDFDSKPWTNSEGKTVYFCNVKNGTLKPVVTGQPARTESKAQEQARAEAEASRRFPVGGQMLKDDYWRNKEERDLANEGKREITQQQIQLQAARNAAIEFVKILAGEKAITYSTAQNKQTPAARLDVLETYVNKYTTQFLEETQAVGAAQDEEQTQNEDVGSEAVAEEGLG